MSRVGHQLKDLNVGDLVYADLLIDKADLANPKAKTSTTTSVMKGKPVRRICIVLVPGDASVEITYLATFHESTTLPSTLDKTMWYPFKPAPKEDHLDPLPALVTGKAQWASLRRKYALTTNPVDKITGETIPATSTHLILAHMKA